MNTHSTIPVIHTSLTGSVVHAQNDKEEYIMSKTLSNLPLRTVFAYAAAGYLWIYVSDAVLAMLMPEHMVITLQTYKGFFFVTVTAGILFLLLQQRVRIIEKERAARIQTEHARREMEQLAHAAINALSSHIAIIDAEGTILTVNTAWTEFGNHHHCIPGRDAIGKNYITHCEESRGESAQKLKSMAAGIRAVIEGKRNEFTMDYPSSDGNADLWFMFRVSKFPGDGPFRAVIAHEDITAVKLSELALRESEKRWKMLVEYSPDIITLHDREGRILFINQFAEGSSEQEVLGSLGVTHVAPDYQSIFKENFQACIAEKKSKKFIYRTAGTNVTERVFEKVFVPLDTYKGDLTVLAVARDITDRMDAQNEMRESEEKFRAIFENNSAAIAIINPDTTIQMVNDSFCTASGYTQSEVIGMKWTSLIPPEDLDRLLEYNRQRIKNANTVPDKYEFRFVKKGGEIRTGLVSISIIPALHSMITSFIDITDRKTADDALRQSEKKYRTLHDTMIDGFYSVSMEGRILEFNDVFRLMLGYDAGELLKKTYIDITPEQWHAMEQQIVQQQILLRGYSNIYEKEYLRIDGTVIPVELHVVLLRDDDGNPSTMWAMVRDISSRKHAEAALNESARLLRESQHVSKIGSYVLDIQRGIWKGSDVLNELFGISPDDDHSIQGWVAVVHPDDQQMMNTYFTLNVLERHERFDKEYRIIQKNTKTVRWVHGIGELEFGKNGSPVKMIGTIQDITDRKQAEDILRENEERLRLSLTAAHQGLYDLNVQTGEAVVNHEYVTMIGYDPETFVETNAKWIERLHPDDKERTATVYREYVEGIRDDYRVEFRQRTASGGWKWILSVGKIISYTPDGKPLRLMGTHTDIDDFKRAEEKQMLQTTALESAANGIVITDVHGSIVWVNRAFTKITGYSIKEALGSKPNLLKSGVHSDEFYSTLWSTITSGKTWNGYIVNKRKDGSLYEDEMTITPVRDVHNTITHFVAVKQDVTERNKTLRRIEEQAMLLDEAHDAIILQDNIFLIQFWNKGAERLFGWRSDEVMGKDIRTIIYQDKDEFKKETDQLLREGIYSGEFVLRTKANTTIIAEVRMNIVKDETGAPQSILSIANDITDKKKIEMQLLRTQRMGSLGTLAGGIAHDLNNVLSPVLLAVDLLKRMSTDGMAQKILESVESSAKRGSEIVKQILAFARGVETQKVLLQPRHLIKEIVGIFRETFPRSITITTNIPSATWTIFGDPTHFHQMIMNLGVNARDAMPDGGTISISASNETIDEQFARMNIDAKPGRYVRFTISDTGTGIPPGVLDKIFEPFFTTKEVGKGTGLGLSTVYTIVKSHDGFITVQSVLNNGTTMNVFLPAADENAVVAEEQKHHTALQGNGELILVVDDEQSIRDVTRQSLESYAYTVITATDGADAIGKYVEHRDQIALVLTDIMMPVMDGRQLIATLREIDPTVKIIASSGMIDKLKITGAGKMPVNAYIDKPYTAETLLNTIASIIHKKL